RDRRPLPRGFHARERVRARQRRARRLRSRGRWRKLGHPRPGAALRGARLDPRGRDVHRSDGRAAGRLDGSPRHVRRDVPALLPPATSYGAGRPLDPLLRLRSLRISRGGRRMGGRRRPLDPEARAVTVRAIAGLAALNLGLSVVGTSFLWAARGLPRWTDVLRLSGLGYLLGVAVFGVIWTQLLVGGVPFGGWGVIATLAAATGVCGAVGVRRGRSVPRGLVGPPTGSSLSLFVTASGIALVGLSLEALFRSARLQSLQAFDAWAFWVPKAKAIYFFGGLDEQIFTTSAGPTYPPIVPILDAAAFHAMGAVDVVTFHLQFWFFLAE